MSDESTKFWTGLIALGLLILGWHLFVRNDPSDPAKVVEAQGATDVIDYAYRLCTAADATGLLSAPCSVSGMNSAVDMSIDTSATEALKMCRGMAELVLKQGVKFDAGWKIRIYSPFSNGNTIAVCPLS